MAVAIRPSTASSANSEQVLSGNLGWRWSLSGFLAGLLITHMLVFDLVFVALLFPAGPEGDVSLTSTLKELQGGALWLGRARTSAFLFIALAVAWLRWRAGGTSDTRYLPVAIAFVTYWACALLIPAIAADDGGRFYAHLYPLVMGLTVATISRREHATFLAVFVWTVLVGCSVSLLMFAIAPGVVAELDYDSGLFAAYPRLKGFTLQPNLLGAIVVSWLLVLARWPLRPASLNKYAWCVGAAALIASQSKTSGVALLLAGSWMLLRTRSGPLQRTAIALVPIFLLGTSGMVLMLASLDLIPSLSRDAFSTVSSVSGRSLIWRVVLDAWQASPWFGYGPQLFRDGAFDSIAALKWMGHAHNQIIDTLGRSGLVGTASLLGLLGALLVGVLRLQGRDKDLGVALLVVLLIQSFSETPFGLQSSPINSANWMLMALVAARAART